MWGSSPLQLMPLTHVAAWRRRESITAGWGRLGSVPQDWSLSPCLAPAWTDGVETTQHTPQPALREAARTECTLSLSTPYFIQASPPAHNAYKQRSEQCLGNACWEHPGALFLRSFCNVTKSVRSLSLQVQGVSYRSPQWLINCEVVWRFYYSFPILDQAAFNSHSNSWNTLMWSANNMKSVKLTFCWCYCKSTFHYGCFWNHHKV